MFLAFLEYIPRHFKLYRRLRGGNWKYVVCKFPAPINGCWIHNEEAFWWEFIEKEEQY
jgi:hypothetical protein